MSPEPECRGRSHAGHSVAERFGTLEQGQYAAVNPSSCWPARCPQPGSRRIAWIGPLLDWPLPHTPRRVGCSPDCAPARQMWQQRRRPWRQVLGEKVYESRRVQEARRILEAGAGVSGEARHRKKPEHTRHFSSDQLRVFVRLVRCASFRIKVKPAVVVHRHAPCGHPPNVVLPKRGPGPSVVNDDLHLPGRQTRRGGVRRREGIGREHPIDH